MTFYDVFMEIMESAEKIYLEEENDFDYLIRNPSANAFRIVFGYCGGTGPISASNTFGLKSMEIHGHAATLDFCAWCMGRDRDGWTL